MTFPRQILDMKPLNVTLVENSCLVSVKYVFIFQLLFKLILECIYQHSLGEHFNCNAGAEKFK